MEMSPVQAASDNLGLIILSWAGIKPIDAKFAVDCLKRAKRVICGSLPRLDRGGIPRELLVKMVLREMLAKMDRYAGFRRAEAASAPQAG
jgi:hypothetical protein